MLLDKILVPTDFSKNSNHALEQAVEIAIHTRASLHLLHVLEPLTRELPAADATSSIDDHVKALEVDAQRNLGHSVDGLAGKGIEVTYETRRDFSAYQGITTQVDALEPDLLVMGTHGRTGMARLVMGSVAEKVLRHVSVDVLTLHEESSVVRADEAFDRILVPVDFSEHSQRALARATSLLRPGGKIVLAHVVASPIHPSFYAGGVTRLFQLDAELPDRITRHAEEWLGDVDVAEIVVKEGEICEELNDIAREHDSQLVVMGRSGVKGMDRMLLGSVTETMVRNSERPVLAVL